MKMTLDLPNDLLLEMKRRAAHEGRKLNDVAAESIRLGLRFSGQTTERPLQEKIKLPLFNCTPSAPATRITVEELIALEKETLEEEDLRRAGITL
jgi:hypothetical protein